MLPLCQCVLVGNPVATILTAGDKKFASSRVIELANSIPKERETLKRITLSALLLVGLCVAGSASSGPEPGLNFLVERRHV